MPRQPGRSDGTGVFVFGIEGNMSALQDLCDRTLNIRDPYGVPVHPDVEYQVMSPIVFLLFMKMNRICSEHPQDSAKGFLREKELNIAIPLLVFERTLGIMIPVRMVWYMPYLWIDSGVAMASGRETFGFPKTMASLVIPDPGDPAVFSVDAETWDPAHTSPPCLDRRIVNVQRALGGNIESVQMVEFEEFIAGMMDSLELPLMAEPFASFASLFAETRFVFLKQFRDHTSGDDACYQAIVEAPVSYPAFHGASWLQGSFEIEIFNYASTPVVSELGLTGAGAGGSVARQQALFAGWLNIDFVIGNGQTIWLAP